MSPRRAVVAVLLPFAAGYYLSYLFRTINALAAERLGAELGLNAAALGLLTAAYLAAFAALQIPVGVALDRFGPRRVQMVLMPVAASGAALFAAGDSLGMLVLARALIGAGSAAALMAGLKALALALPTERLALANGAYVTIGALGAATATAPAEALLAALGWRALFALLAALTLGAAALLLAAAPRDPARVAPPPGAPPPPRLLDVARDPRFWRLAPMSAGCIGTAFAMQGLWAAPWLADVALLDRAGVVRVLTEMALGLCAGAALLGVLADRLGRRGVRPGAVLAGVAAGSALAQLALALRPVPGAEAALWIVLAATGSATVLSYAALAEEVPKAVAGRANALLNLLHIGAACAVQAGFGAVLALWPQDAAGHYPPAAYAAALGLNLLPQAAGIAWFAAAPWVGRGRLAASDAARATG